MLQVYTTDEEFAGPLIAGGRKPTAEELEAFRGLLLGICRTGIITEVTKSQHTRVAHSCGKPNLSYRAAQYNEAQEAPPAKGRFQKAACIEVDLAPKAR